MTNPASDIGIPTGTANGNATATGIDTGDAARYLAADGKPVAVGDKFHIKDLPGAKFIVDSIDQLFIYMKSDGWSGCPRVTKRWQFARKGWVRC